ncbi:ABC transporter substrate-binding protein [Alkalispirochaeta alkalica]|uniref:ABC transporter substrate-binding protein n=1 Tax=Alkalispirochaeta alkalica TaxID=46356 RepID=UPI00039E1712|nr:extracellular solute-binding protein [Alkalispirochaeta alkalica]
MAKRSATVLLLLVTALVSVTAGGLSEAKSNDVVTLQFFHRWPMEPRFSYFNEVVAEFERLNPDIRIEMDMVENESYKEKIRVLISSNDMPDVFTSWSDSFALNLARSGRVRSLNAILERNPEFAQSFIQSQLEPFTFDGITYGLPLTIDGKVLVYNLSMWQEAGIAQEPRTFDELITVLDRLKSAGHETPILEGLANPWAISHFLGTLFQRYIPADVLARDYNEATGEFTHPGYRTAIEYFMQLVGYMGPSATSLTHTEVRNLFIAGRLPMMYMQFAEFGFVHADPSSPAYGFFNFPGICGGHGDFSLLTGAPEGLMMSETSRYPEEAERFVKFLLSQENAAKFVEQVGAPVAVVGAVREENSYPTLMQATEMIKSSSGSVPWLDNAMNIRVADAFMRGVQSVASGDMTIDQVLNSVQAAARMVRAEASQK